MAVDKLIQHDIVRPLRHGFNDGPQKLETIIAVSVRGATLKRQWFVTEFVNAFSDVPGKDKRLKILKAEISSAGMGEKLVDGNVDGFA